MSLSDLPGLFFRKKGPTQSLFPVCTVQTRHLHGSNASFARFKPFVCTVQTGRLHGPNLRFSGFQCFFRTRAGCRKSSAVLIFPCVYVPGLLCVRGCVLPAGRVLVPSQRIHSLACSFHTALSLGREGASRGMGCPK